MWDRREFLRATAMVTAASFALGGSAALGSPGAAQTYTVRRGDTLSAIAKEFGLTVNELKARNGLTSDRINIGQTLIVSAPVAPSVVYRVRSGDTLGKIARNHNTTVASIRSANNLSGDRIFPGQDLAIPAGGGPTSSYRYIDEVVRVTKSLPRRRSWEYIVGHHSGVHQGNARIYDRFHKRKMPNGLAYHFVIGNGTNSGNGEIEIGDRWLQQLQGGHVRTHRINEIGIGICLVGNFEERRPSSAQIAAFSELVNYLKFDLLGGRCKFAVHKEVDGNHTLCPGRYFPTARMHQQFS